MGMTVAELEAKFSADTRDFTKGTDDIERSMKGVADSTDKHTGSMRGAFIGVTAGVTALVGVVKGLSIAKGAVIDFNAQLDAATMAFTSMLGSGEKAGAFLTDLKKFAVQTPFQFPDLITASQRFIAMGFAADEVLPSLRSIGDASAALGGGTEIMNGMITALGQMKAKGKVQAEEMNQLTERGIPAWQFLADTIGTDVPGAMALVTKGGVQADIAISGILEGMDKKFGGMMEGQSHTYAGAMSNIKDSTTQVIASAFRPFYDVVSKVAVGLAGFVGSQKFIDWSEKANKALTNLIQKFMDGGGAVIDFLKPIVIAAWDALPTVIDIVRTSVKLLFDSLVFLGDQLWRNKELVVAIGGPLVIMGVGLDLIKKAKLAAAALKLMNLELRKQLALLWANPIILWVAAIVAAAAAVWWFYNHNENFRRGLKMVKDIVVEFIKTYWPYFKEGIVIVKDALIVALEWIKKIPGYLSDAWDAVKNFTEGFRDWWQKNVSSTVVAFVELFQAIYERLKQILGLIFDVYKLEFDAIVWIVKHAFEVMGTIVEAAWKVIVPIVKIAVKVISTIINTWVDIMVPIFKIAWLLMSKYVKVAWALIKGYVEVALAIIRGVIRVVTDIIKGDWGKVWEDIKQMFIDIWDSMKQMFGTILEAFVEIFKKLPGLLLNVGKEIGLAFLGGINFLWSHLDEFGKALLFFFVQLPIEILALVLNIGVWIGEELVKGLKYIFENLDNWALDLLHFFAGLADKLWEGVKVIAPKIVGWIIEGLHYIWDKLVEWGDELQGWFEKLPGRLFDVVKDVGTKIASAIREGLGAIFEKLEDWFKWVKDFFEKLPGRIETAGAALWDGLKHGLAVAIQWIKDELDKLLGPLDEIAGKVKGWFGGGSLKGVMIEDWQKKHPGEPIPDSIQSMDKGGIVGGVGAIGSPQLLMAHKGETVFPTHRTPMPTGGDVNITVNANTNASAYDISEEIAWKMKGHGEVR